MNRVLDFPLGMLKRGHEVILKIAFGPRKTSSRLCSTVLVPTLQTCKSIKINTKKNDKKDERDERYSLPNEIEGVRYHIHVFKWHRGYKKGGNKQNPYDQQPG